MKLTDREKSQRLLQEGKVISSTYGKTERTVIVEAFGHTYIIYGSNTKRPKIKQLKDDKKWNSKTFWRSQTKQTVV